MADKQHTSAQDLYGTVPIEGGGTGADNLSGFMGHNTNFKYTQVPNANLHNYLISNGTATDCHIFFYNASNSPCSHGFCDIYYANTNSFAPTAQGNEFVTKMVVTDYNNGWTWTRMYSYLGDGTKVKDTSWVFSGDQGTATFAGYASNDLSKGTIEERLTAIEPTSGTFTLNAGFVSIALSNGLYAFISSGNTYTMIVDDTASLCWSTHGGGVLTDGYCLKYDPASKMLYFVFVSNGNQISESSTWTYYKII